MAGESLPLQFTPRHAIGVVCRQITQLLRTHRNQPDISVSQVQLLNAAVLIDASRHATLAEVAASIIVGAFSSVILTPRTAVRLATHGQVPDASDFVNLQPSDTEWSDQPPSQRDRLYAVIHRKRPLTLLR